MYIYPASLRILSEANLSNTPLESVAASLRSYFSKADYFRVGNALVNGRVGQGSLMNQT